MTVKIDGGGVFPDGVLPGGPLPDGYRFRISLTGSPSEDVTIYVDGGRLHVVGQYATVHAERVATNHVALNSVLPGGLR